MPSPLAANSLLYGFPAMCSLKSDLQKLVFPEGVYYNLQTQSFRTEKVNFIFELIATSSGTPPEKKKGTSYLIDYLSLSAGFVTGISNFLVDVEFLEELQLVTEFINQNRPSLKGYEGD